MMNFKIIAFAFIVVLLQGCASARTSYESLIETRGDDSAIYLAVGETKEVLSISNGFPGWWGVYPAIVSFSPETASVNCEASKWSEVCYLTANEVGETWLTYGNQYTIDISAPESQANKTKVIISPK
ncbi:hypothetical protein [Cycloclasticus zancles]|nr:hypothetical protein [Cycloclasticus zancles]